MISKSFIQNILESGEQVWQCNVVDWPEGGFCNGVELSQGGYVTIGGTTLNIYVRMVIVSSFLDVIASKLLNLIVHKQVMYSFALKS